MNEDRTPPIKVAIVGGGCAAMATAFELSSPEHAGRYDVTVYQLGWRLGGKGASGRGPAGRIEEHGLHLWMGWYENAFRMMRACYAELARDPATCPIADWSDAFDPLPLVGVTDPLPDGGWEPWLGILPPTSGLPGDPDAAPRVWTVRDYVVRTAELLRTLLQTLWAPSDGEPSLPVQLAELAARAARDPANLGGAIQRLLQLGEIAGLTGLVQAAATLEMALGSGDGPRDAMLRLVDEIASRARALLEERLSGDLATRRVWQVIDLTLATLRGELRFGILTDPRGFDAIDDYDCREWLLLNGAAQSSVDCGFVRGLYDLGFSYEDGDPTRPRISAGQSLRAMVRAFFTYRGAFFWRMRAGMGDVVFAPFYEVLQRRGVKFEFFHRLENVAVAGNGQGGEPAHVAALEFDVQAVVRDGAYRPLVDVGGVPCWPAEPDWAQLADGDQLRREGRAFEVHADRRRVGQRILRVGRDFDLVVLAVGLGAVPHVCSELVARDPRWRAMVDHVKTVATQAFQVWLAEDMEQLGWPHGAVAVSGFVEPFDTWADMRHLLPREQWNGRARAIGYFCSVLPDADVAATGGAASLEAVAAIRAQVRRDAARFLDRDVGHLWPRAVAGGRFRWDLLVDPGRDRGPVPAAGPEAPRRDGTDGAGAERLASQFWTANVSPTDRYTLSLPGSAQYRISPLDRTYDNLTVAGDWTACGFNAGCVEAAVMSGRLAAHAIALRPALEEITGYDHP